MRLSQTTYLTGILAVANAVPQSIPSGVALPAGFESLPTCAYPAFIELFENSGCSSPTDTACLCAKPDLLTSLESSVQTACTSSSDQQAVSTYAESFCGSSTSSTAAATSTTMAATTGTTTSTTAAAMATGTGSANGTSNSTTPAYSSPSPTSSVAVSTGAARAVRGELGMTSMAGLALAMGGLTWIFAEL